MKKIWTYFSAVLHERKILWSLARNDLRAKFASSFLGGVWAYVQPLITLLVLWYVFEVGFRNPPVSNVPFIVWLTPAYLVWNFFSETLQAGANCLMEYSYLVKKVHFRVSIIPMVKLLSGAFVHVAFIGFIFLLLLLCGVPFSVHNLQVVYYFFCSCFLLLGMCWFVAAMAPFAKDVVNVVSVILQIGFWATPIFWSPENLTPTVETVLKLNPMFYICSGYRDCFINHVWFWEKGNINLYFWITASLLFVLGAYTFRKLRPQFADVL